MGLIDVNVLMTDVRNTITEKSRAFDWINLINRQPTAYDVDKVIQEIEQLRRQYFLTIANTNNKALDIAYEKVYQALDKAIEIVKTGGNI
mgnify:CR=1 FL=1